jgi:alginate O-acetyltransferase complex protein AlgI
LIIADWLAEFIDPVFKNPGAFDPFTLRWAVLAYAGQIYCDFSGYSDIAIGCAKWFGFELPQNFNFPYLAGNIADFWKRWHISLSTWLRDYLYIPLGGSRRGPVRTYVNLIATLTLCGLWHRASWNFIIWGFYNGVLLALHRLYDKLLTGRPWADALRGHLAFRMLAIPTTFLLVAIGLVMARSESWSDCWLVEQALVGISSASAAGRMLPHWAPVLVGLVVLGHLFSGLRGKRCGLISFAPLPRALVYVAVVALLVVLAPQAIKPFAYFQF